MSSSHEIFNETDFTLVLKKHILSLKIQQNKVHMSRLNTN